MKFSIMAAMVTAAAILVSCDKHAKHTDLAPEWVVVTFELMPPTLVAGPTSYGENLYSSFTGERFLSYVYDDFIAFGINEIGGTCDFWNGGVAVSRWNYMLSPADKPENWWYTYENQCSVFNRSAGGSSDGKAGHDGSDYFAVVTGSQSDYSDNGQLVLTKGAERIFDHMYVCNTSYVYGVIVNGESFSDNGPLSEQKGYFELVVHGYKAGSDEPVATDRILLADYRGSSGMVINRWTLFDLENIKKQPVNRIAFEFEGSDIHPLYGLNTPKYVCIDDLCISYADYSK